MDELEVKIRDLVVNHCIIHQEKPYPQKYGFGDLNTSRKKLLSQSTLFFLEH